MIQPRRVGVGRVVDIHAVRKYHSRLGTQRGEAVAQLLEKSVGVRRGNEPSALRKEALQDIKRVFKRLLRHVPVGLGAYQRGAVPEVGLPVFHVVEF